MGKVSAWITTRYDAVSAHMVRHRRKYVVLGGLLAITPTQDIGPWLWGLLPSVGDTWAVLAGLPMNIPDLSWSWNLVTAPLGLTVMLFVLYQTRRLGNVGKYGGTATSGQRWERDELDRLSKEAQEARSDWEAQQKALTTQIVDLGTRVNQLSADLTLEREAHKESRRDLGRERLSWCAKFGIRLSGQERPKMLVRIRFVSYDGDYELVQQIKKVVDDYLGWDVELDGSNNPTLPKATQWKVMFNFSVIAEQLMGNVAGGFAIGKLLGDNVSIGIRRRDIDDQSNVLIVEVLPG